MLHSIRCILFIDLYIYSNQTAQALVHVEDNNCYTACTQTQVYDPRNLHTEITQVCTHAEEKCHTTQSLQIEQVACRSPEQLPACQQASLLRLDSLPAHFSNSSTLSVQSVRLLACRQGRCACPAGCASAASSYHRPVTRTKAHWLLFAEQAGS